MQASHRPHFTFLEQLIIILKGPTRPCQTWPLLTSPGSSRAFLPHPHLPQPPGSSFHLEPSHMFSQPGTLSSLTWLILPPGLTLPVTSTGKHYKPWHAPFFCNYNIFCGKKYLSSGTIQCWEETALGLFPPQFQQHFPEPTSFHSPFIKQVCQAPF